MPPCGIGLVRISRMRRAAVELLLEGLMGDGELHQPVGDQLVDVAGAEVAALGARAQDAIERCADPTELGRQVEKLAELPVPADQLHVLVEHAQAVPHLVERRLQQVAIVLQRLGGIVEQLQRGMAAGIAAAQQQRQHEPRRRRADGAGEQMLGEAQEMDVGFGVGRKRRVAAFGILRERALGALGAEIAGDGALQFAGRDRGAPHAEGRRHRRPRQIVEHEQMRLQPLDRLGRPQQRDRHERRMLAAMLHSTPCVSGIEAQVEQRRAAPGRPRPNGPSVMIERGSQPASMIHGSSSV